MRLPIQRHLPASRPGTAAAADGGIAPSSCCDGEVTIYSPSGDTLYTGSSGCCYDAGQAYCYPCSGEKDHWQQYAKEHFTACQGSTPCSIALTGCGSLTPYC